MINKRLFFICPTDFLEAIINDTFKGENYFLTSLGNSITFETNVIEQINSLIETKGINEIVFILSDDNRIFQDAMENQEFSNITGLSNFAHEIVDQMMHSIFLWQTINHRKSSLSNHLNKKIQELQPKLSNWIVDGVKIRAEVFNRQNRVFHKIQHNLLNLEFSLN